MSFDVIDVLIGFDSAECQMRVSPCQLVCTLTAMIVRTKQNLIESLNKFLNEGYPGEIVTSLMIRQLFCVTYFSECEESLPPFVADHPHGNRQCQS